MFSVLILAMVTIAGFLVMNSLVGEDRRLPSISTIEGKRDRIICVGVLAAILTAFAYHVKWGDGRDDVSLTATAVVIGFLAASISLLLQLRKGGHKAKKSRKK